jgi:hypothetical protein
MPENGAVRETESSASAADSVQKNLSPLHRAFVASARRQKRLFAMGDQRAPKVTYAEALTKTVFLARRLAPVWNGQEKPDQAHRANCGMKFLIDAQLPRRLAPPVTCGRI